MYTKPSLRIKGRPIPSNILIIDCNGETASLTYGVYQIFAEIDTSYKDEDDNTVWNNVAVHAALSTLKTLIKEYYNKEIVPTLFKYEFLK